MNTSTPRRRLAELGRRIPPRVLVAAVVATVAISALVWQHHRSADPPPAAVVAGSALTPPAVSAPPGIEQLPPPMIAEQDSASEAAARAAAQRFAVDFAAPGDDRNGWLTRLAPEVSAQLLEQYRLTDIRNVPQTDLTGVEGPVRQEPGTYTFTAGYSDGSAISIRLETGTEGWTVINVVPLTGNGVRPAPDDVVEQSTPASGKDGP